MRAVWSKVRVNSWAHTCSHGKFPNSSRSWLATQEQETKEKLFLMGRSGRLDRWSRKTLVWIYKTTRSFCLLQAERSVLEGRFLGKNQGQHNVRKGSAGEIIQQPPWLRTALPMKFVKTKWMSQCPGQILSGRITTSLLPNISEAWSQQSLHSSYPQEIESIYDISISKADSHQ